MTFEFATATRVIFGRGRVAALAGLCLDLGQRVLLVRGADSMRWGNVVDSMRREGLEVEEFEVAGEPGTKVIEEGVALARSVSAGVVVGIGGGAVMDAGKAIAAMVRQPGELLEYLEVVGQGRSLDVGPLPFIAVPTTAGTGAEVTRNAVIGVPEHRVKVSLRHASMLPRVALVDPELAVTLPSAQTAASGLDALTQLLEPFVCKRANPMTDALCREGIPRVVRSLERAVAAGRDVEAREDLALGALFSGMALANAGLGAVHGFAAPIGGMFPAPHGAVCAALLAPVWKVNLRRVDAAGDQGAMLRFSEAARLLTGNPAAGASDAVEFLEALTRRLTIPGLSTYGVGEVDVGEIADKASNASSMKANPVELSREELVGILRAAL